jgi:hypothetical protein
MGNHCSGAKQYNIETPNVPTPVPAQPAQGQLTYYPSTNYTPSYVSPRVNSSFEKEGARDTTMDQYWLIHNLNNLQYSSHSNHASCSTSHSYNAPSVDHSHNCYSTTNDFGSSSSD